MTKRMDEALEALGAQMATQNALLSRVVKALDPEPMPTIGHRSDLQPVDAEFMVRHVPVLQIAYKQEVPAEYTEISRELARVNCPCGAVVELLPATMEACPGPEESDCPRFYLFTGETVRVANPDLLPDLPLKAPA